ncbi:MAG: Stp1/IreP family PP2C-type Ser/Thr phosphatase [Paenisporosarcina sp.]
MIYTAISDIGQKRSVNEDRAAMFKRSNFVWLGVVADGMGGHNAGDVASEMAISLLKKHFDTADSTQFESVDSIREWFLHAVKELNSAIYNHSLTHDECQGMGTTLLAVIFSQNAKVLCHIGDSRAYEFFQGQLTQLTIDHSYVNILVENGEITEEEAENHPKKNLIIKSLGTEKEIEPDIIPLSLPTYSYLLLCSDGLSNKVNKSDMAAIFGTSSSVREKGQYLIRLANENGGEDNISLVLISNMKEEV